MTSDKNKTPLKVKSSADIAGIIKLQKKDNKYRSLVLWEDTEQAIYILVPADLNVIPYKDYFVVINYDADSDDTDDYKTFDINVSVKDSVEDMPQNIQKLSEEEKKPVSFEHITKNYGRNKFEQYSFMLDNSKTIVLQMPYGNKFVEFIYMAEQPEDKNAPSNNKGETFLGIMASSLNKAVFNNSLKDETKEDDIAAQENNVLENWTVNKISARQNAYYFEVKDSSGSYGYSFSLPSSAVAPAPEGKEDVRIIIDKTEKSDMWFEAVNKDSKKYNEEVLSKYLSGKKLSNTKKLKFKAGGKNIDFIKKNALNINAYNYFFKAGNKRFVLSFVAPSDKIPIYEQLSGAFLKSFKSTGKK